jgi:ATP-dependent DNA helicase RecG
MLSPDSPVTDLRGVGPARAALLEKLGLLTIRDCLFNLPERHEDRSKLTPIRGLRVGDTTTVIGTVKEIRPAWNRFAPLSVLLTDGSGGLLSAVWFRSPHLSHVFQPGQRLIAHGQIQRFRGAGPLQMLVKDYEIIEGDGDPLHAGSGLPSPRSTSSPRWCRWSAR